MPAQCCAGCPRGGTRTWIDHQHASCSPASALPSWQPRSRARRGSPVARRQRRRRPRWCLQDRHLQQRSRQWLAGGDDLLDEGAGARVRRRSSMNVIHRTTDAAGQLADLRTLISDGVNAIVVNPAVPAALNPALDEANAAGIPVVAVDLAGHRPRRLHPVQRPGELRLPRRQMAVRAARRQGHVAYMRGIAGYRPTPTATTASSGRLQNTRASRSPGGIHGWDMRRRPADQRPARSGTNFDGIWTSGIHNIIVDAFKTAGVPFVPIVGADNSGFVAQLPDEDTPALWARRSPTPQFGRWRRADARP